MLFSIKSSMKRPLTILMGLVMMVSTFFLADGTVSAAAPSHGQLKIVGNQLCNSSGEAVQLKGMSSHGLQWFGNYMNRSSINFMKDSWGANVVRAAMYTSSDGYIKNPTAMKAKVEEVVEAAIAAGIYVIIDWHILSDGNPNTYRTEAKAFFEEMATKYGSYPNVIYEICNEPNGNVTWANDIKPYAEYIIPAIRAIDPDNIIIVGTSNWSQDVDIASRSPLNYSNIMYAFHFYAGTHTQYYRNKVSTALANGIAVFVSEWGTSDASGDGGPFLAEAQVWIDFMDTNKLSWCNWSLCDKEEASAALVPGARTTGGWTDADLTASGRFVRDNMNTSSQPPNPPQQGIVVKYNIDSSWNNGGTVTVTIVNNSTTAINGWRLAWTFPGNQTISNMWSGSYTQSGANVTVTSLSHNQVIGANGGSVSIGFNIGFSGSNTKPASCTLNGTTYPFQ